MAKDSRSEMKCVDCSGACATEGRRSGTRPKGTTDGLASAPNATLPDPEPQPAGGDRPPGPPAPGEPPALPVANGRTERFWVTTFIEPTMTTRCFTRDQVPLFDASRFQFYYDPAGGKIRVVRPSGKVIPYGSALKGVGDVALRIPFGLMTRPGRRMSPFEVASLVGLSSLQIRANFQQRLQSARRAFGEGGTAKNADEVHFLPSERHPYVVWWDRACAFAVTEPESWVEYARRHPGSGWVLFHSILFGEAQLRNAG